MNFLDKYVKKFDINDPDVNYKYHHNYRVMDNMIIIAKSLNLSYKDIELAKCIGLLHDIGRFYQTTKYHSYDDFIFDHGKYGAEVLKKENALRQFDIDKSDYEVVYKAIANHNQFSIDKKLNNREMLFAKMIRDADKLDILYALGNDKLKAIFKEDESKVSKYVKESFFKNEVIKKTEKSTLSDETVLMFGFAYDLNFKVSMDIIKKNKYYEKIYARLKNKRKFKAYIDHVINYINERTG